MANSPPRLPRPGDVISYSYLWADQSARGREEGEKVRPCMVLAVQEQPAPARIILLPITTKRPSAADGLEIPAATAERIGLRTIPCWVLIAEGNDFRWPGPDLRPVPGRSASSFWLYGPVPFRFFERVRSAVIGRARLRRVPRTS